MSETRWFPHDVERTKQFKKRDSYSSHIIPAKIYLIIKGNDHVKLRQMWHFQTLFTRDQRCCVFKSRSSHLHFCNNEVEQGAPEKDETPLK